MKLAELLEKLGEIAAQHDLGEPLICGGVVRDVQLGEIKELHDIDITTGREDVGQLADLFAAETGADTRTFPDGHKQVSLDGIQFDFSTNFTYDNLDELLDKAGVVIEDNDGLARETYSRDFTINALLMPLDFSRVIDPTGMGLDDLKAGVLRCPVDAGASFKASPNRIVRSYLHAAKFGFAFSPELELAIKENLDLLAGVNPRYAGEKFNEVLRINPNFLGRLIEDRIIEKIPHTKYITRELIKQRRLLDVMAARTATRNKTPLAKRSNEATHG